MPQTEPMTKIVGENRLRVVYQRKSWFIFSWWVEVKATSIAKDLQIITAENFEHIYLNGKDITPK
jgi:hypothetical protein